MIGERRDDEQQEVRERDERGLLVQESAECAARRSGSPAGHDLHRATGDRRLGIEARVLAGPGDVDRLGVELVVPHETRTRGLK